MKNNGVEKVTRVERTNEVVKIYYTITEEYQKENELYYKNRILEINLKDLTQMDYADNTQI